MSGIGPTLPPHLLNKRKRSGDLSDGSSEDGISDDAAAERLGTKKPRNIGPSLPPTATAQQPEQPNESGSLNDEQSKLSRTLTRGAGNPARDGSKSPTYIQSGTASLPRESKTFGPALPPAAAHQKNAKAAEDDSESDDDFGPSLPGKVTSKSSTLLTTSVEEESAQSQPKSSRDDWMLAPPTSGDWTSRIDPSKMKNRGFTSGKGSRGPASSSGDMSLWTETPEQKRKRLEDELLGVRKADQGDSQPMLPTRKHADDAETAKKVQAYNDRHRAAPLYSSEKADADEDDPSKRAFDREKDIAGSKLTHAERKQMMNKAADFSSRYSKGTYL